MLFLVSLFISFVLITMNSLLGSKSQSKREKLSPFECGFDPKSMPRLPFSLHFFLIALIFLIFDVEITLILPFPILSPSWSLMELTWTFFLFVLILILGVVMEWSQGALEWVK